MFTDFFHFARLAKQARKLVYQTINLINKTIDCDLSHHSKK